MRDAAHTVLIGTLKSACDEAAANNDTQALRRLHAFLQQTATNYVGLRLGAIERRGPGMYKDDQEAANMESIAAAIIEGK